MKNALLYASEHNEKYCVDIHAAIKGGEDLLMIFIACYAGYLVYQASRSWYFVVAQS